MAGTRGRAALAAVCILLGCSDGGGDADRGCDPTGVYDIMHTRTSGTCGDFPPGQLLVSRVGADYLVQDGTGGQSFIGTVERSPRCRITVARTIGDATARYTLDLAGGRANGVLSVTDTGVAPCDGTYTVSPVGVAPSCGPSTCTGCCSAGTCITSVSSAACGTGGAACMACGGTDFCTTAGVCAAPQACGPGNCAGCCSPSGVCQGGSTSTACGRGGGACTVCSGNQVCRAGVASCGIDPASRWRVQPVSAVITATNNGTDWDGDASAPDVVVKMTCPPTSAPVMSQTPEVQSLTPAWSTGGCVTTAAALFAQPWLFQVFDIDLVADDTITSGLQVQFDEADLTAGSTAISPVGGLQSLQVQFVRQ